MTSYDCMSTSFRQLTFMPIKSDMFLTCAVNRLPDCFGFGCVSFYGKSIADHSLAR